MQIFVTSNGRGESQAAACLLHDDDMVSK